MTNSSLVSQETEASVWAFDVTGNDKRDGYTSPGGETRVTCGGMEEDTSLKAFNSISELICPTEKVS